jgi:hypothetical protein
MAYDSSIPELITGAIRDAQELIRQEISIARAEIRDEVATVKAGVMALAGAAVVGLFALQLLLLALAWGIAAAFDWPAWGGFAVVAVVLGLVALVLALIGRGRLATRRHMPRTVDSMKENAEWLKARTQQ